MIVFVFFSWTLSRKVEDLPTHYFFLYIYWFYRVNVLSFWYLARKRQYLWAMLEDESKTCLLQYVSRVDDISGFTLVQTWKTCPPSMMEWGFYLVILTSLFTYCVMSDTRLSECHVGVTAASTNPFNDMLLKRRGKYDGPRKGCLCTSSKSSIA